MGKKSEENKRVAPVQQGITPENVQRMAEMQQMQQEEKLLEQEMQNKLHDPQLSPHNEASGNSLQIITDDDVKAAMATLLKYKECKTNLEQRIVDDEEFYKLQHWDKIRGEKDKEVVEPASAWMFNMIINKHAELMDNYPEALILPRELSDVETAESLSSIVPVVLEQNDYEQVYSDCGYYKIKSGTSVQGVFWDNSKLNGLGDITIKKIDILNLYWESGITDIQDSKNVFLVTLVDNDELKHSYPNLRNLGSYPEMDTKKYIFDDKVDTDGKSVVVDWYYKVRSSGVDENGIPVVKSTLHYCKFCNGQVLYASENDVEMKEKGYYAHGLYPFVTDVMFPMEGCMCGMGYIDITRDTQMYVDKLQQAILDNALMNARSRVIANDQAGINQEEFADPSKTIVHASGNLAENAYRAIETKPLNGIYVTVLNQKIQELKDTSGNTAASQGQASSVTSASGIASLQEAAGKLARDANKASYRAFKKVVTLVIELMREFYTEERCFRITGNDGKMDFVHFDNRAIMPQTQDEAFGLDLGSRMPVFDVDVRPAKRSAYSKEAQNQMALNFYGAGFFAPQNADSAIACLSMMDFEGKNEVLEQVRKNQTLYDMVMMLQQQMIQMGVIIDAQNGTNVAGQLAGQAQQVAKPQSGTGKKMSVSNSNGGSLSRQAASTSRNATAPQ